MRKKQFNNKIGHHAYGYFKRNIFLLTLFSFLYMFMFIVCTSFRIYHQTLSIMLEINGIKYSVGVQFIKLLFFRFFYKPSNIVKRSTNPVINHNPWWKVICESIRTWYSSCYLFVQCSEFVINGSLSVQMMWKQDVIRVG